VVVERVDVAQRLPVGVQQQAAPTSGGSARHTSDLAATDLKFQATGLKFNKISQQLCFQILAKTLII
jgi:hypothetical protein